MILTNTKGGYSISRHLMMFMVVALCLLSSLPSHPNGALATHTSPGDHRNAAATDHKDQVKVVSSGVELVEVPAPSDDEQLESEEEEAPVEETEGFVAAEKYHAAPKRRLRFQKRYRLRNNKRGMRLHKKKQTSDDAEYGRTEESSYERDLREPRLRFREFGKRPSLQHGQDPELEQQLRLRRSAFTAFNKRVSIGNDLQALADILYEEKQNQAYTEFVEYLKKIGLQAEELETFNFKPVNLPDFFTDFQSDCQGVWLELSPKCPKHCCENCSEQCSTISLNKLHWLPIDET